METVFSSKIDKSYLKVVLTEIFIRVKRTCSDVLIIIAEGRRRNKNVPRVHLLVLDFRLGL